MTEVSGQAAVVDLAGLATMVQAAAGAADPAAVKACCASAYGLDLVGLFLGDSHHPGGAALTRRLADRLGLQTGEQVVDVAAGVGATALLLAGEYGVKVTGVDLGPAQVAKAQDRALRAGLDDRARFQMGDAEQLPLDDEAVDAVVCECAFCTFPDKATAAAEVARVLRPGGRLGLADVWLDPDRLDPELAGLAGRIACLADARPISEVVSILEHAGLEVGPHERHDEALLDTIGQVETRLRALRIADLPFLRGFDLRRGIDLARRAAATVARGDAGYMLLTATKPALPP